MDDEQPIQTLLSFPLQRDGYEVVMAGDGQEALNRFAEQPFDLVVLDLMLPKIDGLEVCRRMRARSAVPIIMLTAKSEEIDKVLGLELGADDYITKPFSMREFRSRVKTRPGLDASALRISNSTNVVGTPPPRSVTARLAGSMRSSRTSIGDSPPSFMRAMPARRSAAFTRERNSRIENGLVM